MGRSKTMVLWLVERMSNQRRQQICEILSVMEYMIHKANINRTTEWNLHYLFLISGTTIIHTKLAMKLIGIDHCLYYLEPLASIKLSSNRCLNANFLAKSRIAK
jgi:hypothetical protein